jgi:hypothetical protein
MTQKQSIKLDKYLSLRVLFSISPKVWLEAANDRRQVEEEDFCPRRALKRQDRERGFAHGTRRSLWLSASVRFRLDDCGKLHLFVAIDRTSELPLLTP